jgi:hypothetical protein
MEAEEALTEAMDECDDFDASFVAGRISAFCWQNTVPAAKSPVDDPVQRSIDEFVQYRQKKSWLGRLWFDLTRE